MNVQVGHNEEGEVDWGDFLPVAGDLLRDSFQDKRWARGGRAAGANPWCRLFDPDSASHYYFNRETQVRSSRQIRWSPRA